MKDLPPDGALSFRTSVAMMLMATIAVALRFFAKLNTSQGIAIEDILMVVALCLFYTDQGVFLTGIFEPGTSGSSNVDWLHPWTVSPFLEMIYIEETFFISTITMVKLSIILFYRRIFRTAKFQKLTTTFLVLCVLWWLIAFFVIVFQCYPVQDFWNVERQITGQASCLHAGAVIFGIEISNLVIDTLILCLPVWMINSLQITTPRKISVGSIFLLGGFIYITSCVRAYYIFDPSTGGLRSVGSSLDWSTAELAIAIVCGCLPTYGRLFQMSSILGSRFTKWYSSLGGTTRKSSLYFSRSRENKHPVTLDFADQDALAKDVEASHQTSLTEKPHFITNEQQLEDHHVDSVRSP